MSQVANERCHDKKQSRVDLLGEYGCFSRRMQLA